MNALTEADMRRTFRELEDEAQRQWREPPVTVHHPRCKAIAAGRADHCNCGGSAFPR